MTDSLFLSRVRLRSSRGEALSAIAPLLIPDDGKKRPGHAHRVLWLLFQDIPDSPRDFLWRDEGGGKYMILSRRPPTDPRGLFEACTRAFDPALEAGDRLRFVLRANPVMASKAALKPEERNGRARGKRVDVVMAALYGASKGKERAAARDSVAAEAGAKWLAAQGSKAGFELVQNPAPVIDGYAQIPVERKKGRPAGFSVLDFAGEIRVANPAAFLDKLPLGFGSAKAFGNGLMLIRRA